LLGVSGCTPCAGLHCCAACARPCLPPNQQTHTHTGTHTNAHIHTHTLTCRCTQCTHTHTRTHARSATLTLSLTLTLTPILILNPDPGGGAAPNTHHLCPTVASSIPPAGPVRIGVSGSFPPRGRKVRELPFNISIPVHPTSNPQKMACCRWRSCASTMAAHGPAPTAM